MLAVILLLAVTGILASVMGAYFFEFTSRPDAPFAVIQFEQNGDPDDTVDLEAVHTRGDNIVGARLSVVVTDDAATAGEASAGIAHAPGTTATNGATTRSRPFSGTVDAGTDTLVAENVESGDVIRIVYETGSDHSTAIVAEYRVRG